MLLTNDLIFMAVKAAEEIEDLITAYDECVREAPQYVDDREAQIIDSIDEVNWDAGTITIYEQGQVTILFGVGSRGAHLMVHQDPGSNKWYDANEHLTDTQRYALNEYVKHVFALWHGRGADIAEQCGLK